MNSGVAASGPAYQPYKVRAVIRVPRTKSCLYDDLGFGAKCFQAVSVGISMGTFYRESD
jgi:hypothetical protein